jgi:subtilase family serine protease
MDFGNFEQKTSDYSQYPTEVVPTAFGGVDPGAPLTVPPPSGTSLGDQSEATLDVIRAGCVAPNANLLLVVATKASGGIEVDVQYLVQTNPIPV